jgi:hypothetical protein
MRLLALDASILAADANVLTGSVIWFGGPSVGDFFNVGHAAGGRQRTNQLKLSILGRDSESACGGI